MPLNPNDPYPEITVKWPAARLLGPPVSIVEHREYVLKTDTSFVGEGFTNNRQFERELNSFLGLDDERSSSDNWDRHYRRKVIFAEELGHIPLNYLGSNWISSSYIGGPHGVIAPSGIVQTARNFGKYPSVAEIESDLSTLSTNFPDLELILCVWGHTEESDDGYPSHTWKLTPREGFTRQRPCLLNVAEPDVMTAFIIGMNNPHREQTYTLPQIKSFWGEELTAARERTQERYSKEFPS